MPRKVTVVGVLSDTHGAVRPQVLEALDGVDLIVHAGDVDTPEVLAALEAVAPVTAVRGNMDGHPLNLRLRATEVVEAGGVLLYVLHDLSRLDLDPAAAQMAVVINGHTHRPAVRRDGGVLYLNPGSAGPRRSAPPSVAKLYIENGRVRVEILPLKLFDQQRGTS